MAVFTPTGISHLRITVSDIERSRTFYTEVLGFDVMADAPPPVGDPDHDIMEFNLQGGIILNKGSLIFGLRPMPNGGTDRFDENRVGLDHVSFSVASLEELRRAEAYFDAHAIPHGSIKDLGGSGMYVLEFRDPENIQLELAAPKP